MITVTCIDRSCGVEFGIPEHVERQARRDNQRRVHCPNGHPFIYNDSEPEKLRKQIESLEHQLAAAREQRDRHYKTIVYWRGIAHRKPRARK